MSKYFVYRVGSHIVINGLKFDEKVFKELHKGFDPENATVITYDGQKAVFSDGLNQWNKSHPWPMGDEVLLRFHDIKLLNKYTEA